APVGRRRLCGDHDQTTRRGGGPEPWTCPLLLRLNRKRPHTPARAFPTTADQEATGDVWERGSLHREVAHGDAVPGGGGRSLREGLARAPGPRVEPRRAPRSPHRGASE